MGWWIALGVRGLGGRGLVLQQPLRASPAIRCGSCAPVGQVWFSDGGWWTFCRRQFGRVPRHFEQRSNPLDHEEVVAETWMECKERRRYKEVEY
jgi:hypothetical protein